jgi:hypothetical protein
MKRTASFPADFGALGVGNERSCGWNSGAAQGIRAEFRIQFPRHSKRRNSGPNSVISNSWPNSIHPNGVFLYSCMLLMYLFWCVDRYGTYVI